ncbi:MAG: type II toxin-antitoxin system Phd/YefM family antitoxin [Deferrisomatales bacterium]
MDTKTIDVRKSQIQLPELMRWVRAGTEVLLSEGGLPLARVVPIPGAPTQRKPGLHPGAVTTTADFDEPLDDEFWTRK